MKDKEHGRKGPPENEKLINIEKTTRKSRSLDEKMIEPDQKIIWDSLIDEWRKKKNQLYLMVIKFLEKEEELEERILMGSRDCGGR
jgi:hypothetical protein